MPKTDKDRTARLLLHDFQISGTLLPPIVRDEYLKVHRDILRDQALVQQGAHSPAIYQSDSITTELKQEMINYGIAEVHYHNRVEYIVQYSWLVQSRNRDHRRESYLMYNNNSQTASSLQTLIDNRRKMSHILGFDSFASRALMTAAPENPDEVI